MPAALKSLAMLVLVCGFAQTAAAEDWMFRRSYFSHVPAGELPPDYPLPVSRSAYRIAHYRYGFGVNAGYRINNYIIQNGNRTDQTIYTEGWVEFSPQP